jgi:hypothetical protein
MSDQANPLLGPGVPAALLYAMSPRAEFVKPPTSTAPAAPPAAVFTPSEEPAADARLVEDLRRLAELRAQMG